jgi:hypothetical protein
VDNWKYKFYNDSKITVDDITKIQSAIKYLTDNKRYDEATEYGSQLATIDSEAGRLLQANTFLRATGKQGYLRHIESQLRKLNREGQLKYGKKWVEMELNKDEIDAINNTAEDDLEARNYLKLQIGKRLIESVPYNAMEMLESWRKIAMLSSGRTIARNTLANVSNKAIVEIDNVFATLVERILQKDKSLYTRTIDSGAIGRNINKDDLSILVDKNWTKNKQQLLRGNMNERATTTNIFGAERLPFSEKGIKNKMNIPMNRLSQAEQWAMNNGVFGDSAFFRLTYKDTLYRYLKARNTDVITPEAELYAKNKALEATFKVNNDFIKGIMRLKNNKSNYGYKALGTALDVALPFVKTPINVLMTSYKHSFVSIITGAVKVSKYNKGGKSDIDMFNEGVDDLAKGLTGSILTALGAYLLSMGIISPPPEEDYKKSEFLKSVGQTPFALHIGDKYYPITWAQPAMTSIIAGASAWNAAQKKSNIALALSSGLFKGADVVLDLPFLKTMQDILSTKTSSEEKPPFFENLSKVLIDSTLSQLVPNILTDFGKARTMEATNARVPDVQPEWGSIAGKEYKWIRNFFETSKNKLRPELFPTKYDVWGQPVKRAETIPGNIFNAFIAPFTVSTDKTDSVTSEILRLSKEITSGEEANDMLPSLPQKYLQITNKDGENEQVYLTMEQASEWTRINGTTSKDMLEELFKSNEYKKLSDDQKLKAISSVYSYSVKKANNIVLKEQGVSSLEYSLTYDETAKGLNKLYVEALKLDPNAEKITFPRDKVKSYRYNNKDYEFDFTQQMAIEKQINEEASIKIFTLLKDKNMKLKSYELKKKLIDSELEIIRKQAMLDAIRKNFKK